MKRTMLCSVLLAAGGLALLAQSASVQAATSTTTLPPMYHTDEEKGAVFMVFHNSKPPAIGSESTKDDYSVGDRLVFSAPLYSSKDLDSKGAKPVATFYAEATVLKGGTFATMLTMLYFDFVFANGDHVVGHGLVDWTGAPQGAAITGGTGTYEGAGGTIHHSKGVDNLVIIH